MPKVLKPDKKKERKQKELWIHKKTHGYDLCLPLPPSINATYKTTRSGQFYKATGVKEWEEQAGWEIAQQWKEQPLTTKLVMQVKWFFLRERDISSGIKVLEDALQTFGVIMNDSQIYHTIMIKDFDKTYPRVEITLAELVISRGEGGKNT